MITRPVETTPTVAHFQIIFRKIPIYLEAEQWITIKLMVRINSSLHFSDPLYSLHTFLAATLQSRSLRQLSSQRENLRMHLFHFRTKVE